MFSLGDSWLLINSEPFIRKIPILCCLYLYCFCLRRSEVQSEVLGQLHNVVESLAEFRHSIGQSQSARTNEADERLNLGLNCARRQHGQRVSLQESAQVLHHFERRLKTQGGELSAGHCESHREGRVAGKSDQQEGRLGLTCDQFEQQQHKQKH